MDQTQTPTADMPVILSGQEIYDMIMSGIEPELTSSQLPLLDEKYVTETEDEKNARADRYEHAFEEYDKQFQAYSDKWADDLRKYKRAAVQSVEQAHRDTEENDRLASVQSSLDAS
jgi:hypothetical protein